MINQNILDYKSLIQNNTSLDFQSQLTNKLQEEFTDDEQTWFIANFCVYLQYHPTEDFPIKLDNVWDMIGFATKGNAKRTLENNFIEGEDYKLIRKDETKEVFIRRDKNPDTSTDGDGIRPCSGDLRGNKKLGGRPEETILLNIDTFKNLCMITKTEKAKKIRKYYIKLENLFNGLVNQQRLEYESQLQLKEQELIWVKDESEKEKEALRERTLIEQFPLNTLCIYYGKIDNTDAKGDSMLKFGMSNNLADRIKTHKKTYKNFRLINAIKVPNHIEIENCIKKHPVLKKRIRSLIIDGLNYRELICISGSREDPDFSLEKFEEYIKEIIEENVYNLENYKKLLQRNEELERELHTVNEENKELFRKIKKLEDRSKSDLDPYLRRKIIQESKNETMHGYTIFAFKIGELRYKIGMCKNLGLSHREELYKTSYPDGFTEYKTDIKHPFMEKCLLYLVKRHLTVINNDTFEGSIDDIKQILECIAKVEELLINNDVFNVINILGGQQIEIMKNDPEIPTVRKAKRPIDQIDPNTDAVIRSYSSIEEAGRSLGLTTGTAIGNALRNKGICKGYLWRYSGISKEDQMKDQPVMRIECSSGTIKKYPNIASAARDAKVSSGALRNRILTDTHINGFHWIFNKEASHYMTNQ